MHHHTTSQLLSFKTPLNLLLFQRHHHKPSLTESTRRVSLTESTRRFSLSKSLQSQTLEILEWSSLCTRLSPFTQTSMGRKVAGDSEIPIGRTLEESRKLLNQTAAAVDFMTEQKQSQPLDLTGIEDISRLIEAAVNSELLSLRELCTVRRTLRYARAVWEKLQAARDCTDRYASLLDILVQCNFQIELERKIRYCIDCDFSKILNRASEELEIIRSERKRNMEVLDDLLKEASTQIFQAGGIDKPLITTRRSRLCVGIRAAYKHLLPGGVILGTSSSGATYFMEPKEAVELNNMEVQLSISERAEENAILSMLTSEISESSQEIKYLLDRLLEIDLAFARAGYAQLVNGVCPIICSNGVGDLLSVDIEAIKHPLLLDLSQKSSSDALVSSRSFLGGLTDSPVPIDIKVKGGTRVVVISGPNTGGKTASMKTLGLASLMSKAGMYLPAKNNPTLPWFDLVLADIGDHQSLEQNLSTFSGHISRICKILEVVSESSLVLLDEIGSGTDPSEGVALAASILHYLRDHASLSVVTTHYADLSHLKDKDTCFENAAMEFSLETLQPTYKILWGSVGDSNALSIAKSIGFDSKIIEGAQKWMERLVPEKQQERKGLLYKSLMEERDRLKLQVQKTASLHADIMDVYKEIYKEAEDLDGRKTALMAKETRQVEQELEAAKSQIDKVVEDFEKQLTNANPEQFNSLLRKSESAIASIVEAHSMSESFSVAEDDVSYTPQIGEKVLVRDLGNKLATVIEACSKDDMVLVQYGKIRVRVKKSNIGAIRSSRSNPATKPVSVMKKQGQLKSSDVNNGENSSYGPSIQTSKNTIDLRGMRVEEAANELEMAIASRGPKSTLFVVHGMGTGAVKERALEILRNHPRVVEYDQENPTNYGCTVAYIK
ncbi:hypothetical protein ACFE04_001260 [Oxalis oulophora]